MPLSPHRPPKPFSLSVLQPWRNPKIRKTVLPNIQTVSSTKTIIPNQQKHVKHETKTESWPILKPKPNPQAANPKSQYVSSVDPQEGKLHRGLQKLHYRKFTGRVRVSQWRIWALEVLGFIWSWGSDVEFRTCRIWDAAQGCLHIDVHNYNNGLTF